MIHTDRGSQYVSTEYKKTTENISRSYSKKGDFWGNGLTNPEDRFCGKRSLLEAVISYSITGDFMSKIYGIEAGTYGFIVNVMREFITVASLSFLRKISMGSPILEGRTGNMDTMLATVKKFVGVRLELVTLVTGTILTFIVPFLLPILSVIIL